jgi:uncharacterized membrane protein
MVHKRYEPHQTVCWIGEAGGEFFIVETGRVEVVQPDEDGKEIVLAYLGHGGFFGELSLLDGGPRSATVRTVTASTFLTLGRDEFLHFVEKHPAAMVHMLSEMGKRQRETLQMLRGIANPNVVLEERATFPQRCADLFTSRLGSWTFIVVQSAIYCMWMLANVLLPETAGRWDAYPFGLLSLIVSAVSAYATPIIMMSQNRQSEKERVKADLDYQVNVKAHHELMQLQKKVDRLTSLLTKKLDEEPEEEGPATSA